MAEPPIVLVLTPAEARFLAKHMRLAFVAARLFAAKAGTVEARVRRSRVASLADGLREKVDRALAQAEDER